jgi:hypothetical protein
LIEKLGKKNGQPFNKKTILIIAMTYEIKPYMYLETFDYLCAIIIIAYVS